jgi:4-amino-4-deoxychorismate lyase
MYPLFETIKILKGVPQHLLWHQSRLDFSFRRYFKNENVPDLKVLINVPAEFTSGIVKCRIPYSEDDHRLEFSLYKPRKISSLKIVNGDHIKYSMKYTDRSDLEELTRHKDQCDDILIVRNNLISDTSFTNIVFWDGVNWVTPRIPLLKGTCRSRLLAERRIKESDIRIDDLRKFKSFKLINAMKDLDEIEEESVEKIDRSVV